MNLETFVVISNSLSDAIVDTCRSFAKAHELGLRGSMNFWSRKLQSIIAAKAWLATSSMKEYTEHIKLKNIMLFRRSIAERIANGESPVAGESYIYLDATGNVAERKATQRDIEVACER